MPDAAAAHDAALMQWALAVKAGLERARRPFEGLWRDIRDNFEPTLGRALDEERDLNESAARRADRRIVNSRPRDVAARLACGLQSGITNQARQWFRLVDKSAVGPEAPPRRDRMLLASASELVEQVLAGSNAYVSLISIYKRLGLFGTAAALLLPDEEATLRLEVLDEGSYWIGQDRRARVCVLLRRCEWTARQVAQEFGPGRVPQGVALDMAAGRGEEFHRCWNLVAPAAELPAPFGERLARQGAAFASLYWCESGAAPGGGALLAVRPFGYNPIIAPRWDTPAGSAYGVGPGQLALPDAKGLQVLEVAKLKLAEEMTNPAIAAPETMRQTPPSLNPGAVTYYRPADATGQGGYAPIQPIDQRPKRIDAVEMAAAALEQRLGRLFYEDLFAMLLNIQMGAGRRQMTATEVSELASEKISLLGPVLTRLNVDLLRPLVVGAYALCLEEAAREEDAAEAAALVAGQDAHTSGRFALLAAVDELPLDVEYSSTLHIDQQASARASDVVKCLETLGLFAQYGKPEAMDWFDADAAARSVIVSYMDRGTIMDPDEVETLREGRAAAQEQQMRLAQQGAAADAHRQGAAAMRDIAEAQRAAGGAALAPAAQMQEALA